MYYYQRLKDLREDADKSQAEIARILEISQQHYSQYERGERELPMHLFIVLQCKSGLHDRTHEQQGRVFKQR